MAFLTAETFDFAHSHSLNADLGQGFLDVLHFEGLDDGFDFFHVAWKKTEAILTGKHQDHGEPLRK